MANERERTATKVDAGKSKNTPEWIEIVEGGAARVTLGYAIEIAGVKTNAITMRRPKVRDRMEADKIEKAEDKEIQLFSTLTDLAPDELQEIDLDDYTRLQEAFRGFLSSGRQTR